VLNSALEKLRSKRGGGGGVDIRNDESVNTMRSSAVVVLKAGTLYLTMWLSLETMAKNVAQSSRTNLLCAAWGLLADDGRIMSDVMFVLINFF
jgi:hypothetical protein